MAEVNNKDDNSLGGAYAPWNFSWIVENKLAGMACPTAPENLNFLWKNGIRHLVTLSPEILPPVEGTAMESTIIPVEEFEAPTIKDITKFIDVCQQCNSKNEAVGVHCHMGRGRTGVMAACFLVRFQGLAPKSAIVQLRLQRPGSVEGSVQERAVVKYHDYLRGTKI